MSNKKILFIFGTRPEAIKMAPLIRECKKQTNVFATYVCITGQHREMLDQVMDFFQIEADYDLNLMTRKQSVFDITAYGLKALEPVLTDIDPDVIVVQGDTTTAFIGALAGYYRKVRVAHVEAGLRSNDKYSPFPEEVNRALVGRLADYHFAPTDGAANNLEREGIRKNVWVVGNTVIDALLWGLEIIRKKGQDGYARFFDFVDFTKKVILVTGHRRESFGRPFESICFALRELAERNEDIQIVYPVHLNPNVQEPVGRIISNVNNIHLIEPISYPNLLWLLNKTHLVLTDSGGIQEEAPTLGKPVLVMRDVTERKEGVEAGTAKLVGTDHRKIVTEATALLREKGKYALMAKAVNPYGDGRASQRIVEIFLEKFWS
jgi:UDP-N-acetylglucosamine 2-epimerase (non-hydrolysing)